MALEARVTVSGNKAKIDSVPEGHRPFMVFQDGEGRVYFVAKNIETENMKPKTPEGYDELFKRLWEEGSDLLYIGDSGKNMEFVQTLTINELKTEGPHGNGFGAVLLKFDGKGHNGTLYERVWSEGTTRMANYNGKSMVLKRLQIAGD